MTGLSFRHRQSISTAGLLFALFFVPLAALSEAKPAKIRDLADTVAANPIMTKFAAILLASPEIGTLLSSRGPFTLFVPTDAAFDKLPPGTLDALLRPENKVRLEDILLFHVVNGQRLTAKDLLPLKSVLSCQGAPLTLKTTRSGVQLVQKAKIIHADIRCRNGIIDEVDTVLMPPEASLPPLAPPPPPNIIAATNAPPAQPSASTTSPSSETNASTLISPTVPTASPATNAP